MDMLYTARDYQLDPLQRLVEGATRNVWVWHRRSGKDLTAWNWTIMKALTTVGGYYYFLPTREQAKKVIWNNYTREGVRFTKFVPPEAVAKINEQDLRIEFKNGSMIQLMGADNFDGNVGASFRGAVFSEYSVMSPLGWDYMEPIAVESGAWVIFVYTPRGSNHGLQMYHNALREVAAGNPKWSCFYYPVDVTKAMNQEELEESRRNARNDRRWLQEYMCQWETLDSGAIFAEQIENVYRENRLKDVPYDPSLPVYTSWDVGVADPTAVWFWQKGGAHMRLIDYYEENRTGLNAHAKAILERPYTYAGHFFPHDMKVMEFGTGQTRIDTAEALGLRPAIVVDKLPKDEQYHAGRSIIPVSLFDAERCGGAVEKLGKYGYKFNENDNTYSKQPKDNENSHAADAFMVGAVAHTMGYITSDFAERDHDIQYIGTFSEPQVTYPKFNPLDGLYAPLAYRGRR